MHINQWFIEMSLSAGSTNLSASKILICWTAVNQNQEPISLKDISISNFCSCTPSVLISVKSAILITYFQLHRTQPSTQNFWDIVLSPSLLFKSTIQLSDQVNICQNSSLVPEIFKRKWVKQRKEKLSSQKPRLFTEKNSNNSNYRS